MHAQPGEIATVLGLPNPNAVTLLDLAVRCEDGLPVKSLHDLARVFAPNEQAFLNSTISRSTLRRRKQRGKLTAEESDLLVRLAATWLMASHTFGSNEKARRFLFREHSLLGGQQPLTLAAMNMAGTQAVEQVLGRLKYGSAA